MEAKHTPGPLMVHGPSKPSLDTPEGGDYCVMDGGTNIIAEFFHRVCEGPGGTRSARENAMLFAAGPSMLNALRLYIEWCEAEEDHSRADFYQRIEMCRAAEIAAREAIAEALGTAPEAQGAANA